MGFLEFSLKILSKYAQVELKDLYVDIGIKFAVNTIIYRNWNRISTCLFYFAFSYISIYSEICYRIP